MNGLPPGLSGYVAGREMDERTARNELERINVMVRLQQAVQQNELARMRLRAQPLEMQKLKLAVESAQQDAAMRSDPEMALDYASRVSGIRPEQARSYESWRANPTAPASTATDELGTPMPDIEMEPPIGRDVSRLYNAARAAFIANRLATGKTNADQLTQAGGNVLMQRLRNEIAAMPDIGRQNQLMSAVSNAYREPYSNISAQGLAINQETGEPVVGNQALLSNTLNRIAAQEAQARAAAGYSAENARDLRERRPGRMENTTAQAAAAYARAEASRNPPQRPGSGNEYRDLDKARAQYEVVYPKSMAGMRLGKNGKPAPDFETYYQTDWPRVREMAGVGGGTPAPRPQLGEQRFEFKTPDEVKAAFGAGRLPEAEALRILREQFGFE